MNATAILNWLKENDPGRLNELWAEADRVRAANVGDEVHLRGLIEISNNCVRECGYCGLRHANRKIERYRMERDEILECAKTAVDYGYGTVVLQAGEDYALTRGFIADVVTAIKSTTPLAVTLSLGEREFGDLEAWHKAGANRYLLRFETSDHKLYEYIHPALPGRKSDRFEILKQLHTLGYEVGSGVMIGIPGQSFESLARDIGLFKDLDLDMIGVGPFIANPDTPLGDRKAPVEMEASDQVPNSELMVYKVIALTRLLCPQSNIPSTTALATLNKEQGRELGLQRGANIIMPNLTPLKYRQHYQIYPGKACISETAQECNFCIKGRIAQIGRRTGRGQGARVKSK